MQYDNSGLPGSDPFHCPSGTEPEALFTRGSFSSKMGLCDELCGHSAPICFFRIFVEFHTVLHVTDEKVTLKECSACHFNACANKLAGVLQALGTEVLHTGDTSGHFRELFCSSYPSGLSCSSLERRLERRICTDL